MDRLNSHRRVLILSTQLRFAEYLSVFNFVFAGSRLPVEKSFRLVIVATAIFVFRFCRMAIHSEPRHSVT